MHRALTRLADIERYAPGTTASAHELLETALVHVTEASVAVRALAHGIDTDPARIASVESRLGALHDAGRKHRVSPDELPGRLFALREELEGLETGEARIRELQDRRAAVRTDYRKVAERLSEDRSSAARRLADEVTLRMRELGMDGGAFSVAMNRAREERASGIDEVEFRIRANPGHPPTPLAQTASGGEQSRVSLGILVATRGGLPVMVFDEIDSGVGGRVAELVGRHLRRLAESCQVLCVTHLPQVASQAHGHLTVSKGSERIDDERAGADGDGRGTNRGDRSDARGHERDHSLTGPCPRDARVGAASGDGRMSGGAGSRGPGRRASRRLATALAGAVAVLAAGCGKLPEIPVPGLYRVDIRQGNALDDAALARLEPGMTRSKVLHLLGTPAIDDVFHADRWEYLFSYAPGGEPSEWRRIALHFEDDRLVRIEGDLLPADAVVLEPEAAKVIRVPPRPPEKGLFSARTPEGETRSVAAPGGVGPRDAGRSGCRGGDRRGRRLPRGLAAPRWTDEPLGPSGERHDHGIGELVQERRGQPAEEPARTFELEIQGHPRAATHRILERPAAVQTAEGALDEVQLDPARRHLPVARREPEPDRTPDHAKTCLDHSLAEGPHLGRAAQGNELGVRGDVRDEGEGRLPARRHDRRSLDPFHGRKYSEGLAGAPRTAGARRPAIGGWRRAPRWPARRRRGREET